MDLENQRKDKARQEEEELKQLKRATVQETEWSFLYLRGALLVFEAWDLNTEQYRKVAGAVQNAIQCDHVIYDEEKELLPRHHWTVYSRG